MKNEQEIISHLLSIIESQIEKEADLEPEELSEYAIAAIWAHKKFGRVCPYVHDVVDSQEGISMADLMAAGLTYEDLLNTYHHRKTA